MEHEVENSPERAEDIEAKFEQWRYEQETER